jgi:hypothetical protein
MKHMEMHTFWGKYCRKGEDEDISFIFLGKLILIFASAALVPKYSIN